MSSPLIQTLVLAAAFFAAAGFVAGLFLLTRRSAVDQRVDSVVVGDRRSASDRDPGAWTEVVVWVARPLARLTQPKEGWEESELRRRFIHAGWRNPSAAAVFFGAKTLLGLGLPVLFLIVELRASPGLTPLQTVVAAVWLLAAGYYAPNLALSRRVQARQREIFEAFPDALDLVTICVEAGLSLDSALTRVAREIRLESAELADELELVTLEMRAGAGKDRALRNLALRTGVEDIESLVALLVQAERFGTSIGESLRIQSDTLRVRRQHRAEEAAAKIGVKLIFPLVLCILPSIFVVAAGPAFLHITGTFRSVFGGS